MAKNAAVIGHPIAHSKSPLIHNYWMKQHDIVAKYEAVDIAVENFETNVRAFLDQDDIAGINVTLPHKKNIVSVCKTLEEQAQQIGAVNTVYKDSRGDLIGTNTDAYGFWQNIVDTVPNFSVYDKKVCVVGAGGAARAVIYALKQQGAGEIIIANRSANKAESLAGEFGVNFVPWEKRDAILENCALLVNTTSLGMKNMPELELDLSLFPKRGVVNDIVYNPLQTALLQAARKRGNTVVTGIGMLLFQAQKAFEYWYGILPEVDQDLMDKVI